MAVAMTRLLAKTSGQAQSRTRATDDDWAPGWFRCDGWAKTAPPSSLSCVDADATAKQVEWATQRPASNNSFVGMAAAPGS